MQSSSKHPNYESKINRNLSNYYPLLWQFQELSSRTSNNNASKVLKDEFSPREEIYRSMIKELTNKNSPVPLDNGSLVKKASGILRLSHLKNQLDDPSTFPDTDTHRLKRVSFRHSIDSVVSVSNDTSVLELKPQSSPVDLSRSLNFKEIWDYMDATPDRSSETAHGNTLPSADSKLKTSAQGSRPPWRYFSKPKGLDQSNNNNNSSSSIRTDIKTSSRNSSVSSFVRNLGLLKEGQKAPDIPSSRPVSSQPKRNRMQRSCVNTVVSVRGQLVAFKGEGFENITNWFEDPIILKYIKARSTFRKELDLSGFTPQEIRFRLYDDHKLVVEAIRSNSRDALDAPARFKHTVVLPKGVQIENLIMCRQTGGKLIIQDVERPV